MSSREEITQKYLFIALEELAKHRGSIKKGRSIEQMWRKELLYYENVGKYREENNCHGYSGDNCSSKDYSS